MYFFIFVLHIVLQAELLQTQAEVKNLLNRLNQLSKDRQEMVSGSVHNKLIQIADERAQQAELKVKELEQEVILSVCFFHIIICSVHMHLYFQRV